MDIDSALRELNNVSSERLNETVTFSVKYMRAGVLVRKRFRRFVMTARYTYNVEGSYHYEDKGLLESVFYEVTFKGKARNMRRLLIALKEETGL